MAEARSLESGRINRLVALRHGRAGLWLDGGSDGEVLLPAREAPEEIAPGATLEVFVLRDSDGTWVATQKRPRAQVGEVALLKVVDVSGPGAFLDWGLSKDLLLPHGEQRRRPEVGEEVLVMVFRDAEGRVAASQRLDDFLTDELDEDEQLAPGQPLSLVVAHATDLGLKVVVNDRWWGLVYRDQVHRRIPRGTRVGGYLRRLREDGRLDVSLEPLGAARLDDIGERIYARLVAAGGVLPFGDKSDPEAIKAEFQVSKSAFRQAIGGLYRQRRIVLGPHEIRLPDA
ncbi:CvfB family protein [Isoalcanivorax beigongshangi]|uniref:S1 RNA-binding domain-containing protein n=1 Tax=Isoalcanivorax beigongshangi TaxID=3238810 RepID=A0ABV4AF48_9GAMM